MREKPKIVTTNNHNGDDMMQHRLLRTLEATSIVLFSFHGLRVILSVMFGIIYDQVLLGPIDAWLVISNLLVVAVLLAPLLTPRRRLGKWLMVFSILAAISRVALTVNHAGVRYWGSLAVLASSGLYIAVLLKADRKIFVSGIVSALVVDQLLRSIGHSYDLSLRSGWLPIQALWGVIITVLAIRLGSSVEDDDGISDGLGWLSGLALSGFLFLETSLLAIPNGVARWSSMPYPEVASLLIAISVAPIIPEVRYRLRLVCRVPTVRICLAALLFLGLMIGYFNQGAAAVIGLLVAQVVAITFLVFIFDNPETEPGPVGVILALGQFILLILNFFNAFAFTYPYVLPMMRGMGWVVFIVSGIMLGLGAVVPRSEAGGFSKNSVSMTPSLVIALVAIVITVIFSWPRPSQPLSTSGTLRVATYNIHYGYDDEWRYTLEEIAQTIEDADVDIVAMQEVDAGRMTSYSVDNALYLARRLGMNAAYLPTVEHLTGIALLYRGPRVPIDQRLLTSLQEQTGIVHVDLTLQNQHLHAYGIWMGLSDEDTERQIEEALDFIGDRSPAVFGGDFNAVMGSPVTEAIEGAGFIDPFTELGIDPAPPTSPAINPESRIDFVWLRGISAIDAWVSESIASDHRMVVVEVGLR
jgi:endonuclease/exonuclease/phosphatase family metal-dependent hydrolase